MKLIFLVSQPRSGSTMLQAVLSNHSAITTSSEPWVQLMQVPFSAPELVKTPFDWNLTMDAVNSFSKIDHYPCQAEKLLKQIADDFYAKSLGKAEAQFFLDKTPRYYFILEHLFKSYPDAYFLILQRHPASVLASICSTWVEREPYNPIEYYSSDLIDAPKHIASFMNKYGDETRVKEVSYEDLLRVPDESFASIFQWLGLDYSESLLNYEENSTYRGKYGDPLGVKCGKVKADKTNTKKNYADVFPNKRHARLASGLTDYYLQQGYKVSGANHWEKAHKTREFSYYMKMHKLKQQNSLSGSDCCYLLFHKLRAKLGV